MPARLSSEIPLQTMQESGEKNATKNDLKRKTSHCIYEFQIYILLYISQKGLKSTCLADSMDVLKPDATISVVGRG